jgi:catechol 2,3-dioxygenase-like lactoylglutathione lyase family enzyme
MNQSIGYVALLVSDYDEAIHYFTQFLGFDLIEDSPSADRSGQGKRWVLVAPKGAQGTRLLLARASNDEEVSRIGNQTGGRVFLFLHTDDFWRDFEAMTSRGVKFLEKPRKEPYGTVAVFEDFYGNKWDLLELKGH